MKTELHLSAESPADLTTLGRILVLLAGASVSEPAEPVPTPAPAPVTTAETTSGPGHVPPAPQESAPRMRGAKADAAAAEILAGIAAAETLEALAGVCEKHVDTFARLPERAQKEIEAARHARVVELSSPAETATPAPASTPAPAEAETIYTLRLRDPSGAPLPDLIGPAAVVTERYITWALTIMDHTSAERCFEMNDAALDDLPNNWAARVREALEAHLGRLETPAPAKAEPAPGGGGRITMLDCQKAFERAIAGGKYAIAVTRLREIGVSGIADLDEADQPRMRAFLTAVES